MLNNACAERDVVFLSQEIDIQKLVIKDMKR
jgi:hypothetical protein